VYSQSREPGETPLLSEMNWKKASRSQKLNLTALLVAIRALAGGLLSIVA
jgi:hypothetical protein